MRRKKLPGFASDLESHRGEVIADFQQFYGIPLPLDGEPQDAARMALLWAHLPADSRCARRHAPELAWGASDYLLWRVEHLMRQLMWSMSDVKKRPASPPEPLRTPAQEHEARRRRDNALAARGEIDRILGIREVRHG